MKISAISVENGFHFEIDGQRYTFAGIRDKFAVWRTHCPECGNEFEALAPIRLERGISRRCSFHRRAGTRVQDTSLAIIAQTERDRVAEPLA